MQKPAVNGDRFEIRGVRVFDRRTDVFGFNGIRDRRFELLEVFECA